MSAVDHITDEDIDSLQTKNEMLSAQLELAYAMIDVAIAECDHKIDYDYLKGEAKRMVAFQAEKSERESLPPQLEQMDG